MQVTHRLEEYFHHQCDQLGGWEQNPHIAIACSGGADSLALAILAHQWVRSHGGQVTALIVDHGLRDGSATEAQQTQAWLQAYGIDSVILYLDMDQHASAKQERARHARYDAMMGWCRHHQVLHLMAAHHQDDQAETVLFRLLRGSGLHGLAAMPAMRFTNHVRILRPLLPVKKAALIAYLEAIKQPWVEDPSNQDRRFSRVQIRQFLNKNTPADAKERLAVIAENMANLRHADDIGYSQLLARNVTLYPCGVALLRHELFDMKNESVIHCLSRVLTTIDGRDEPPRYRDITLLWERMRACPDTPHSLHRCVLSSTDAGWWVGRELAWCQDPEPLSHAVFTWDRRFSVKTQTANPVYQLGALGERAAAALRQQKEVYSGWPVNILSSLAAVWYLDEVCNPPHISKILENNTTVGMKVHFTPANPLAGLPFYRMNSKQDDRMNITKDKHAKYG